MGPATLRLPRCRPAAGVGTERRARPLCGATRAAAGGPQAALQGGALALAAAAAVCLGAAQPAGAIKLADAGEHKLLCDAACEESIAGAEPTSTPSGLRFIDITEGNGAAPLPGDQVSMNTVGSIDKGPPYGAVIFEDSLDRGSPIDIRVGTEEPLLIKGLDEGVMGMKMGGVRRLFIEGDLSYGKDISPRPGIPAIPKGAPVVFDVELVYIPGAVDGALGGDDDADDLAALEEEFGL